MTPGAMPPPHSAWPEIPTRTRRVTGGRLAALAVGLAAAFGTIFLLPPATYRAQTLVGIANPTSPYATALIRAASARTVSKPVLALAAQSLNETGVADLQPGVVDRFALAFGFGDVRATSGAARLAAALGPRVATHAGDVAGSLQIVVADDVAETAAKTADAVAQALVKVASDDAAHAARLREREASARLDVMRGTAIAARKRLADLGGADADPEQMRATIAAQVNAAQARLDAIRNLIASGNPPLADRRDMPPTIEALQSTYLDLTRQLAKARETLGDRHTTIISLQDEVRHASAELSTEWRRLAHLAEGELKAARARQSSLPNADSPALVARRDALADARREVEMADAAFVRAQAAQGAAAVDEPAFRIIAPAAVPNVTSGLSIWLRGLAAIATGLLAAMAALVAQTRPLPRRAENVADADDQAEPVRERDDHREPKISARRRDPARSLTDAMMQDRLRPDSHRDRLLGWAEKRLERAMSTLLPRLDTLDGAFGGVPTVVVATCDSTLRTASVSTALARAAAADGRRVLLVEPLERRPELAALADLDAEPIVLDFFGTLRVALSADRGDGALFLAPAFADGAEIAAALARNGSAEMIDDLSEAFDLVVVDGGEARETAAQGWGGDAYVRGGTIASARDDRRITDLFDAPAAALLGTIVGGRLLDDVASEREMPTRETAPVERPVPRGTLGRPRLVSTAYGRPVAATAQRARR